MSVDGTDIKFYFVGIIKEAHFPIVINLKYKTKVFVFVFALKTRYL